jgi:lipopolysaccharide biosynthesis glycosyltransferase
VIVTAIDEKYWPGLVALHNSIEMNSPGFPLYCIVHGTAELAEAVWNIGVFPLRPPDAMDNVKIPTSSEWLEEIPAMYSRLWIPELFPDWERTLWLDADTIVLDDLTPLFEMDLGEYPIASTVSGNMQGQPRLVNTQVDGLPKGKGNFKGCTSGVIVFNHRAYKEKRILEQCRIIMNESKLNLKFVVQSVLNLALRGDFLELNEMWQVFANRHTMTEKLHTAKIVHYVGYLPWEKQETDVRIKNCEIWNQYAGSNGL